MDRKYRIARATDFKRVRDTGRSTAHPLVVLITMDGSAENCRVGIITSKSLGKAVTRNRVRRQLRAVISAFMPRLRKNVDILIIARKGIVNAQFIDIRKAVELLMVREKLLDSHDNA